MSDLKEGSQLYQGISKEENDLNDIDSPESQEEQQKIVLPKELKSYEVLQNPLKVDFSQYGNGEDSKIVTLKHYWTKEEV